MSVIEKKFTGNLNYGNIAWRSTTRTKLKKIATKQRQTIREIYVAEHANEKKEEMKVLNILKLNIYQVLTFMLLRQQLFKTTSEKHFIIIPQDLVTAKKVIFCQTKQNFLFRLKVQGSGIGF